MTAHSSLGERAPDSARLQKKHFPHFHTHTSKHSGGFTLIELMIVVALLGIFASIAMPAFSSLIANNRVESTASEFYAVLMAARADAVTKRTSATLSRVDTSNWELKQGGETQRTIRLPDSVTLNIGSNSLIFRPDGTAESRSFVLGTSKSDTTYTVTVQPSGAIRLSGPTVTSSS